MDSLRPPAATHRRADAPAASAAAEAAPNAAITADEQDIVWMMRTRAGDREAFAQLVECHQARVVGTVARMLGADAADAEDIGQQVFLRVWKSAARYAPTAKFTTWLYTITRNLVFNELRRRKHRPASSLDAGGAEGAGSTDLAARCEDPRAAAPDASLLAAELQSAVADAIAGLPPAQRMAVVLWRHEELSYEEIARALNVTVPAVKSLMFRARVFLKERLGKYLKG